ncbi:hypothetical protein [Vallitalea maricola]|uniref:Uncharacterized protein n=1 Tax=Vallitalea maricola TaxID=3074433 RepID=A0ACB5UGC8_9FIRM|nr:hypothetical protein AN2V17_09310 [Vallitalea sp. AN17-2]
MNKNSLFELKKDYDGIQIPTELNDNIQAGIERGRSQMNKNNKNTKNTLLKICASFAVALTLVTAGINMSSSFAKFLQDIPYVGNLVKVLQFNNGKSGGGSITDGTDISDIDSFEKDGYENIIINFSQDDGLQENVGAYKVSYNENPYTMTFEIGGARAFSAEENFEKLLENKYVKDVYKIITLDDSMIRFVIEFNGPVEYKVEERKSPASIIVGLKEDKDYQEKKTYSLRTQSYEYGAALGSLEEGFIGDYEPRILKDENGLFFVEISSFATKEEAEKQLAELAKSINTELLVEERTGIENPQSIVPEITDNNETTTNPESDTNASNESASYSVSITEDGNQYYGKVEILSDGLSIYNDEDKETVKFDYKNIQLTKSSGENSFVLEIKSDDKNIMITGVYSDFFEELGKYIVVE